MAFRLKLVPSLTRIDFFRLWRVTFGVSVLLVLISAGSLLMQGLNFGIDFRGGTTIRTESTTPVDLGAMRDALGQMDLGDVTITEIFDPTFGPDQHVAQVRLSSAGEEASVTPEQVAAVEAALQAIDPEIRFTAVESVGAKVSGELVWKAFLSLVGASAGILLYVWLRFEWQFALGAIVALMHDAFLTIGLWSLFQLKFDLTTVAAVLTIIGFSVNDTVVIFDRVRENLMKYKQMPLKDLLNLTINETLSRTMMTSFTALLALLALFAFGGDVIRGFVFAMIWGVIVGVYSTVYVASVVVLWLGVSRDWSKQAPAKDAAASPLDDIPPQFRSDGAGR